MSGDKDSFESQFFSCMLTTYCDAGGVGPRGSRGAIESAIPVVLVSTREGST
jgi:hypothetical protein